MLASGNTHTLEIVLLFLLIVVAFFAGLARRINIPYPILLVLAGLAISFVPHVPQIPLRPDLFFSLILPPLLYAAAWQTNYRDFRRNIVPISMLAIGLVGFTVIGVALFADHFIRALDFRSGFLLGAVVAATDAVAATSIARTLGISPRLVSILEGESLVNDATALLALEFGLTLLLDGISPSLGKAIMRFAWLILGGAGVGLVLGRLMTFVEQLIDEGPLEMVVSLIVPYVAYLTAEELKASGVLAVVTCGVFLSRRSAKYLSAPARLEILSAWRALDFILNGFVFVLIGLQLPYILAGIRGTSIGTLLFYGLSFSALLIVLRLVWAFPSTYVAIWTRRYLLHQEVHTPSTRGIFLVGWTGMRGVVSLAAAFSLPWTLSNGDPFAQRNLIVFLTFSIIFVTLVLQGLTLPPLIRVLGLNNNREREQEEYTARCRVLAAAIDSLTSKREKATSDDEQHDIDDMLHLYQHRLKAIEGKEAKANPEKTIDAAELKHLQRRRAIAKHTVGVERHTLHQMLKDGSVGDETIRILERELDLTETRFTGIE